MGQKQTKVALRDEQLSESQAESRRLYYALEQEELEARRAVRVEIFNLVGPYCVYL